jgi:hypothetical protein
MEIVRITQLRIFAIHDELAFVFNKESLIYAKDGESVGQYCDDKFEAQKVMKDSHYHKFLLMAMMYDPNIISPPIE